jgi:uncharacterized protein YbbC (DUF1343 family)
MRMPIRHGMTVGELARMYNGEKRIAADLHVVAMQGWTRQMWFDETGLEWVNQSPNIRSLTQATLYPGVCLLEGRIVWVKGGVDTPFQMIGASFLKAQELAQYLNRRNVPGVSFVPRRFSPTGGVCSGHECDAVEMLLLDRKALNSVLLGVELLSAVNHFYPDHFDVARSIGFSAMNLAQPGLKPVRIPGALLRVGRRIWQNSGRCAATIYSTGNHHGRSAVARPAGGDSRYW